MTKEESPKVRTRPRAETSSRRFDLRDWSPTLSAADVEYQTKLGAAIVGRSEEFAVSPAGRQLRGKVQLVLTSPPYPLNRKKKYGNETGGAFKKWLVRYAELLKALLSDDGSIVIEMGNAWESGRPVMSTLALETLLAFKKAGGFFLCQEFIWHNTAKLPTPAQWVTVERIRAKDSFTRLWWLSKTDRPKADNRRVLVPYSRAMQKLLAKGKYNAGRRPSDHNIRPDTFLQDNGGAITANVLNDGNWPESLIAGSNTSNGGLYEDYCRLHGYAPHPARMPAGLAAFFIQLCTEPGDLVFDPFGGSNTTGAAAEALGRQWVTVEAEKGYAAGGAGRFPSITNVHAKQEYDASDPAKRTA